MHVKIYQCFYEEDQKAHLDPAFIPHDNTENKTPDLAEYPLLLDLYEKNQFYHGHWGMVSWRWKEKTNIDGFDYLKWIKKNPGYDVYVINHDPYAEIKCINPFVQGELHHKGMIDYGNRVLKKYDYNINLKEYFSPKEHFVFSHYYVGNEKFWCNWILFLQRTIQMSRNDPDMNMYLQSTTTHRKKQVSNFCFAVERLISLFFLMHKDLKILKYNNSIPKPNTPSPHIPKLLRK